MKYKYSRKKIANILRKYLWMTCDITLRKKIIKNLLAKKEDKKEWKPCDCPKGGIDGDGRVCDKCGGVEWVKVKSTPSPLGGSPYPLDFFEEIEEIGGYISFKELKINSLIRNQKKLYQFIKEKL